jgi:hypothetical protein
MSGIQDEAYSEAMAEIERLTGENARLKKLNLMTDDELVLDLKSEINHLKTLLTRAADALDGYYSVVPSATAKQIIDKLRIECEHSR